MKKAKEPNAREKHRANIAAAMPDIKNLVQRYGRSVVNGCLKKIAEIEKSKRRLAALKAEVSALEKQV